MISLLPDQNSASFQAVELKVPANVLTHLELAADYDQSLVVIHSTAVLLAAALSVAASLAAASLAVVSLVVASSAAASLAVASSAAVLLAVVSLAVVPYYK